MESLCQEMLPRNHSKIAKVKIAELSELGINYASSIKVVEVALENGKIVHAVAKFLPSDEFSRSFGNSRVIFNNELVFYQKILPALQAKNHKIIDLFPTFLGGKLDEENEQNTVIFLENLKKKHYEVCGSCDLETTRLVLQKLAQFHAVSFAFKQNHPEEFQREVWSRLKQFKLRLINNEDMRGSPDVIEAIIGELQQDELSASNLEKIQRAFETCARTIKHFKNSPEYCKGKFVTLIHGDLWQSNIMVNTDKDIKFLDLQIYQHASIALDLIFFLFTSVEGNVLRKNLDDLILFYFKNFQAGLVEMKCNTELSFGDFEQEMREVASWFSYLDTMAALGAVFPNKEVGLFHAQDPNEKFVYQFSEECKKRMCLVTHLFLKKNWI